jgi:hypothetical protein
MEEAGDNREGRCVKRDIWGPWGGVKSWLNDLVPVAGLFWGSGRVGFLDS